MTAEQPAQPRTAASILLGQVACIIGEHRYDDVLSGDIAAQVIAQVSASRVSMPSVDHVLSDCTWLDGYMAGLAGRGEVRRLDELKRALTALEGERAERNRIAREAADYADERDAARAERDEARSKASAVELEAVQAEVAREDAVRAATHAGFVTGACWAVDSRQLPAWVQGRARAEADRRWPAGGGA